MNWVSGLGGIGLAEGLTKLLTEKGRGCKRPCEGAKAPFHSANYRGADPLKPKAGLNGPPARLLILAVANFRHNLVYRVHDCVGSLLRNPMIAILNDNLFPIRG